MTARFPKPGKPSPATALAGLGQLLCLAAVLTFVLWSAGGEPQRAVAATQNSSAIGLTVTAPRSVKAGDPLALTLTVTNQTGAPCSLSTETDGTVGLEVRRDGVRQFPDIGAAKYVQPLSQVITHDSRVVAPGASVTMALAGAPETADGGQALETVSLQSGYAVSALWSLDQPGRYTFGVTYAMPGGKGTCVGRSGTATVTVTVAKCAQHSAVALWLPRTLGGLGALATAASLVIVLGRRRRGFAQAVAAACVTMAAVGTPGLAHAVVMIPKNDPGMKRVLQGCEATFDAYDPTGRIWKDIRDSNDWVNIIRDTDHDDHTRPIERDGKVEALIRWNPDESGDFFEEDVAIQPCATLYHELVHAFDILTHNDDARRCDGGGDMVEEIRATRAENLYRAKFYPAKGNQRTMHDFKLPDGNDLDYASIDQQCHLSTDARDKVHVKAYKNEPGGGSTGDPHITTFDGAHYDFQSVGEFVLAKAEGFEVQERQAPMTDSRLASVNTALGLRVGSDRLSFAQEGDGLQIRLNGTGTGFGSAATRLPGGGTVSVDDDGHYVVTWPDTTQADILPLGPWGLIVEIYPSQTLKGKTRGLLGDDDGNSENDLVTGTGATLPIPPDTGRLYGAFADTWRVTDAASLLPYPAGTTTATFTDRTFPSKPVTVDDLDPGRRATAKAACQESGIGDQPALDDCIMDVALSGQPEFATGAAVADDRIGTASRPVVPPVVVRPGGTLHDGEVASGVLAAGQEDTYRVDAGSAPAMYLVDIDHTNGDSGKASLNPWIDPPSDSDTPAFIYTTNYLYALKPGVSYTVHVTRTDGDTGPYSFRLVTAKEKRMQLSLGEVTDGNLEQPGRADIYSFTAPAKGHLYLEGGIGCDLSAGVADDAPRVRVYTPSSVCWNDLPIAPVEAGKRYDLVIWSFDVKEGPYSFTAVVK